MTLHEQMEAAAATDAEKKKELAERGRERDLEKVRRMVGQTFGTPTGEQVPRLEGHGTEPEYALPEGAKVMRHGAIVDGIAFGVRREAYSAGQYLAPALTCPDCEEKHLGSAIYATSGRIADYKLVKMRQELISQRADDHRCYQSGTAAVVSAARLASEKAKGITPSELLQRGLDYFAAKGEW